MFKIKYNQLHIYVLFILSIFREGGGGRNYVYVQSNSSMIISIFQGTEKLGYLLFNAVIYHFSFLISSKVGQTSSVVPVE